MRKEKFPALAEVWLANGVFSWRSVDKSSLIRQMQSSQRIVRGRSDCLA